ncbi:uncharacterized protein LOC119981851 [Tripterygium wilfordii]|uniref:uncharacterized protein LOC119981851 n=1 Tax=Tripterygium wilfordii TaxID=458696 RepID=UPI0018F7E6C1|nr:uncharacterized protein LOC119981851 [Tripterygium wilfordii]
MTLQAMRFLIFSLFAFILLTNILVSALNYEDMAMAVKKINKPLIVERVPIQLQKIQKDQLKRSDKESQTSLRNRTKFPKETIPITETTVADSMRANFVSEFERKPHFHFNQLNSDGYKVALAIYQPENKIYGAQARINLWNPSVERNIIGYSTARIRIISGPSVDNFDAIEVGWLVNSSLNGEDQTTRFFVSWTNDAYRTKHYYRSVGGREGFKIYGDGKVPGAPFDHVSTYGSHQYDMIASISKNKRTKNWWLEVEGKRVGFWRKDFFPHLEDGGSVVDWGGLVSKSDNSNRHSRIEMGSGHFPTEGYTKASYFDGLKIRLDNDDENIWTSPGNNLTKDVTNPQCYDIEIFSGNDNFPGFYYGGPGDHISCI